VSPALRRLIVAEAHRRATGRCAVLLHALGTGESFVMLAQGSELRDETSGLAAQATAEGDLLIGPARVTLSFDDAVLFRGRDLASGARFTGRAGGGASVTLYADGGDYFQYAVVDQAAT
jgi:hypothetical protein